MDYERAFESASHILKCCATPKGTTTSSKLSI
jgi:hypothetical protein